MTPTSVDNRPIAISVEVTLVGESRYAHALAVLETLRQVTDEFGAAARLTQAPATPTTSADVIEIRPEPRTVLRGRYPVDLTRKEFDLLLYLAENPRHAYTRPTLLRRVWGYRHTGERTVDVHVRRIRSKLGLPVVTTVRCVGYRLADDAKITIVRGGQPRPLAAALS